MKLIKIEMMQTENGDEDHKISTIFDAVDDTGFSQTFWNVRANSCVPITHQHFMSQSGALDDNF